MHNNFDQLVDFSIRMIQGILIKLVEFISDPNLKEQAISTIVIKIARIGVQTKNRDFLQRAVGLTCEIEGQKTRSVTLQAASLMKHPFSLRRMAISICFSE